MGQIRKLSMDSLRAVIFLVIIQAMVVKAQDPGIDTRQGELSLGGTFFRLLPVSVHPSSVNARSIKEKDIVKFHLFNRGVERSRGRSTKGRKKYLTLHPSRMAQEATSFNSSLPTMIIIHGFLETNNALSINSLLSAVSRTGRWNVVVVDWRKLAAGPWYPWAVLNTRAAGRYVANFVDSLAAAIDDNSINDVSKAKRSSKSRFLEDLHIVGFSLGAHVAGIAGHYVTAGKVGRITGLDPAYPLIELLGPLSERLDKSDAKFVDVIHTSDGIYGTPFPMGHADFFPNGGKAVQPGCETLFFPTVCSHWRAWRFFAESLVNEKSFESLPCDSWKQFNAGKCDHYVNDATQGPEYMGLGTKRSARGKYYLRTYDTTPFSMAL